MTSRVMTAHVSTAQNENSGRWHVVIDYEDGEQYVSRESWHSQAAADLNAQTWALANFVPESKAS